MDLRFYLERVCSSLYLEDYPQHPQKGGHTSAVAELCDKRFKQLLNISASSSEGLCAYLDIVKVTQTLLTFILLLQTLFIRNQGS